MQEAERDAEQLAVRGRKVAAIANGYAFSIKRATDAEALQDQISGGRITSGAGQTFGVTADQGRGLVIEKVKVLDGEGNVDNVKKKPML